MNPHRPYEVIVPASNRNIWYTEEGADCLRDEVYEWLHVHCPDVLDWDMDFPYSEFMQQYADHMVFSFAESHMALLFKLTWCGK